MCRARSAPTIRPLSSRSPCTQCFRVGHDPVQHESCLLHLGFGRVHRRPEQAEEVGEVPAPETGMRSEERLEEEAEPVHVSQRVLLVRKPGEGLGVAGIARQTQLAHEPVVIVLHVVHERRPGCYAGAERRERPRAARLAESLKGEHGRV